MKPIMRVDKEKEEPAPKLRILNHDEIWKGYSETAALSLNINHRLHIIENVAFLWPILSFGFFEFRLVEFFGFESSLAMITNFVAACSEIGLPGTFLFIWLMIIRICIVGPFDHLAELCASMRAKPEYDRIQAQEQKLRNSHLKKNLPKQLAETITIYQRGYEVLGIPRSLQIGSAFILAVVLVSPKKRLGVLLSILLSAVFPSLKKIYRYFNNPKKFNPENGFKKLNHIFHGNNFKIEQGQHKNRKLNLFSFVYSRENIQEEVLIKYMRLNSSLSLISLTTQGLIFKISRSQGLDELQPIQLDLSKKPTISQGLEIKPADLIFSSGRQDKVKPVSKKKKRLREGLSTAGTVRVNWSAVNVKLKAEKKLPEKENPNWLKTFYSGADEILKINSTDGVSNVLIFIIGSAMEDIREKRREQRGQDIDLLILVSADWEFIFPKSFEIFNPGQNDYNNYACDYQGLKIDITLKKGLDSNEVLNKFLEKNDFSHSRAVIPYKNNHDMKRSLHSTLCIQFRVLSTFPNKAKILFQQDPYLVFRALSAMLSGYQELDSDMFEALNDSDFCFQATLRLPPKRVFMGINKLLNHASHPVMALVLLRKFKWLGKYFQEADITFELTLARICFLFEILSKRNFEKDFAFIYTLLLWPSFSTDKFYRHTGSHFSRAKNLFKNKNLQDGILFPGKCIDSQMLIIDSKKSKGESANMQNKISLLLYGLSRELKGLKEEDQLIFFDPNLVKLYQSMLSIVADAYRCPLPKIDYPALMQENLYLFQKANLNAEAREVLGGVEHASSIYNLPTIRM